MRLDPERCTLFIQSRVKQHAELFLLLGMITPLGWLERVPTYKEQQEQLKEKDLHTFGFLGYPCCRPRTWPCTRRCGAGGPGPGLAPGGGARDRPQVQPSLRQAHKPILVEPHPYLTDVPKILGLDGRKMSKSYGNAVELGEDPESARKRIMVAVTDPARKRRNDPGHPEVCPIYWLHRAYSPPQTVRAGRPRVPHRRHRLRRLQEDAAAKPHSRAGEAPGRARRAGPQSRPGRRAGATGIKKATAVAEQTMTVVRDAVKLT